MKEDNNITYQSSCRADSRGSNKNNPTIDSVFTRISGVSELFTSRIVIDIS